MSASSDEPRGFLGQPLDHLGGLTEERLDRAYRQERTLQGSLGGLLACGGWSPEVRAHARAYLAAGNPRDAALLAQRAQDLAPSEEAQELLRAAERALLEELRAERVEAPQVPTLTVPAAQLKTLGLSPGRPPAPTGSALL